MTLRRLIPLLSSYRSIRRLSIPATFYRGGSSKGLFFVDSDLPQNADARHDIFRRSLGAPDPFGRQLNGMGGGYNSVSKVLTVVKSEREDADVEYTFVQVGPKDGLIDIGSNCGNMLSAVGPFAVDTGMVSASDSSTTVRIYNTNTKKVIHATFPTAEGKAHLEGDFGIDGVSGTGAKIELDFINPSGSRTGKLFPTGNRIDNIQTESRTIRATLMDCGNPCVFISANDLDDFEPTILPAALEQKGELLQELEQIRRKALVMMKLAPDLDAAAGIRSIPKVCVVSSPSDHTLLSGDRISASQVHVVVRCISSGDPHKALPITAALCVAAAASSDGTVVSAVTNKGTQGEIVVGHPSGSIAVSATMSGETCSSASVMRTARKLFEGKVFA